MISSFSLTAMPAGVTFQLEVDPERGRGDSGQLDADLYEVMLELGELAREAEAGVVFLFDEMQFAERDELAALLAAHHRIGQLGLPIALVGAGLPQLAGRLAEASSYAERLFAYVEVGRLSDAAAREALVLPAQREGSSTGPRPWSSSSSGPSATRSSSRPTAGWRGRSPAGRRSSWPTPRTPTSSRASSSTSASTAPASTGRRRWSAATWRRWPTSARAPSSPPTSAPGSARTQQATAVQRQRLIDVKGLIYRPQRGYVDFTAPLFGDWIRRTHPAGLARLAHGTRDRVWVWRREGHKAPAGVGGAHFCHGPRGGLG